MVRIAQTNYAKHETNVNDKIEGDSFGRGYIADILKTLILTGNIGLKYVLGIIGKWGTGKTWVMCTLKKKLERENNIKTFWFDAWKYENEENLFYPLICSMEKQIGNKFNKKDKTNLKQLKTIVLESSKWLPLTAQIINPIAGTCLKILFRILGSINLDSADTWVSNIDKMTEKFDIFIKDILISEKDKEKVIVFIDDLDRCLPESIIRLLEKLKQIVACGENSVIFILGIDQDAVRAAIKNRYSQFGCSEADSYLNKIITYKIDLPDLIFDNLKPFLKELINKMSIQIEEKDIEIISNLCTKGRINSIRVIKQVFNKYHLIQEIYSKHPEFNPLKISSLLLIKEQWPSVFEDLLQEKNIIYHLVKLSSAASDKRKKFIEDSGLHILTMNYIENHENLLLFARELEQGNDMLFEKSKIESLIRMCLFMEPSENK